MKKLAKEIANIVSKTKTIPVSDKFSLIWGGGETEVSDTWAERMRIEINFLLHSCCFLWSYSSISLDILNEGNYMAYTILYIAASEDGFIADKHGDIDWLPQEAPEGEDFGFEKFLESIDVITQGRRTFLQTLSFIKSGIVPDLPYSSKHMYVFTREPMETDRTDVTFVPNIEEYLSVINREPQIKRVWLLGGAELIASFKAYDLIDECIITVIPKTLHEGIALPSNLYDGMQEVESRQFSQGIIERRYIRKKRLSKNHAG